MQGAKQLTNGNRSNSVFCRAYGVLAGLPEPNHELRYQPIPRPAFRRPVVARAIAQAHTGCS